MKAVPLPSSSEPAVSFTVRSGNRVFPGNLPQTDRSLQEVPELVSEDDGSRIRSQLAADLWQRMEFLSLDEGADHDKDELIETYGKSLSQIVGFGEDVHSLILAVCRTNLESRAGGGRQDDAERRAAVGRKFNEMIEKASPRIMPPKNVLTADLIALPGDTVYETLKKSVRASVVEFVKEFFAVLERLVDKRIAGLIEWLGDNLCRYHFFKEVVIHEGVTMEETVSTSQSWLEQDYETITTKRTVENEYRLAHHEHHVTHAFHTSIANSRVVVPLKVQGLIDKIPGWLAEYIDIVDGSLFRERVIERKYDEDTFTDVQTRDVPVPRMGWEPAVVIGSIVLTGWGPREIDAELARRKALETTDRADR